MMITDIKLFQGDCRDVMSSLDSGSIDLIVTSPPYNVGIQYDTWIDTLSYDAYRQFTKEWLTYAYRLLKDDGRIAINILYEANLKDRGGRVFFASDIWCIMHEIGYQWGGLMDLKEIKPHRVKYSAWGSWLSPSSPYLYNPKECVIIAYKNSWKKKPANSESKSYKIDKALFIKSVSGEWDYTANRKQLTKACFSEDIPFIAINMLSYPGDIVMDPFSGSGTTGVVASKTGRHFIGIELSEEYLKIMKGRLQR